VDWIMDLSSRNENFKEPGKTTDLLQINNKLLSHKNVLNTLQYGQE
jgi:hypothetical protein